MLIKEKAQGILDNFKSSPPLDEINLSCFNILWEVRINNWSISSLTRKILEKVDLPYLYFTKAMVMIALDSIINNRQMGSHKETFMKHEQNRLYEWFCICQNQTNVVEKIRKEFKDFSLSINQLFHYGMGSQLLRIRSLLIEELSSECDDCKCE